MYSSIIVPLDGSTFGEYALPYATAIARASGAQLELVHVHVLEPAAANLAGFTPYRFQSAPNYTALDDADRRIRERDYLEGLAERLGKVNGVPTTFRLLSGDVEDALLHEIDSFTCDLVVMSTHARGALARFWLGGVAHRLIHHVKTPVLLVPAREEAVDITIEKRLHDVMVTLDGSPLAEQILDPALALADACGARVTLLSVVSALGRHLVATPAHPGDRHDGRTQSEIPEYLAELVTELSAAGITAEMKMCVHQDPAWSILDFAERHKMDAIALATHGRTGLSRMIFGSVADRIVEGSPIPVLVHRPEHVLETVERVHDEGVVEVEAWRAIQKSFGS
jgi:nucleotide-binding universal stress UspA family protein